MAHPPNLGGRIAARAVWALATVVGASTRWQLTDESSQFAQEGPDQAIFVVWHNRQLLAAEIFHRFVRKKKPQRRLASIASASRDGAIAARVLELSGVHAARGSSSRRGARALVELISLARQGFDLAVTPDGPRGPRYEVKPGVIALAQHTGLPLVPISYFMSPKKVLPSWDGFQVPLPFGRCEINVASGIQVPRDLDEEGRLQKARELQEQLRAITRD